MNLENLRELHALTDAKYKAQQQVFQQVLQRENSLRADLKRLEEQARLSISVDNPQMKSIGADIIWSAWLEKAKTSLNMRLAQVLAEKDQHIRQVRQAYGKVMASEELLEVIIANTKKSSQTADLKRAIEVGLISNRSKAN